MSTQPMGKASGFTRTVKIRRISVRRRAAGEQCRFRYERMQYWSQCPSLRLHGKRTNKPVFIARVHPILWPAKLARIVVHCFQMTCNIEKEATFFEVLWKEFLPERICCLNSGAIGEDSSYKLEAPASGPKGSPANHRRFEVQRRIMVAC